MHEVCGLEKRFDDAVAAFEHGVASMLDWRRRIGDTGELVSGSAKKSGFGVRVGGMASTQARQTARARARAAQQKVLVDRKRRDDANMTSLTAFFTAAEQIDAAQLAMARALDDIRTREGTLTAASTLAGITTGEARKLLALLNDDTAGNSQPATTVAHDGDDTDGEKT